MATLGLTLSSSRKSRPRENCKINSGHLPSRCEILALPSWIAYVYFQFVAPVASIATKLCQVVPWHAALAMPRLPVPDPLSPNAAPSLAHEHTDLSPSISSGHQVHPTAEQTKHRRP